jgi:hypothetical protein
MTVTILGKEYPVTLPARHAERHELCMGYSNNATRGSAAILGLCVPAMWVDALTLHFTYKSCAYDVGEYGARCWEVLRAAGVSEAEFIGAASPVFVALAEKALPGVAEVKERVGFSGASEGP